MKVISVFEYDKLHVGEKGFTQVHFNALVLLKDRQKKNFFNVGFNKIEFKQYVGVIQVGNLSIEILPKADRHPKVDKWKKALLTMLKESGYLKLNLLDQSFLNLEKSLLIEIFFKSFLTNVKELVHKGLIKQYRKKENNNNTLKGKLIFAKNIKENIIHKERFYINQEVYDTNHLIHQVLKQAIYIITKVSKSAKVISDAKTLSIYFDQIKSVKITVNDFQRIKFNRKNKGYRYAFDLARLIIQNYSSGFSTGRNNVLALLFDMNVLFEKFIYNKLKRASEGSNFEVDNQIKQPFWVNQSIRPDILLEKPNGDKIIIDTKWKVLYEMKPSDNDLKQMYVYNLQFAAQKSILMYPKVFLDSSIPKPFEKSPWLDNSHSCQIYFVNLFDERGNYILGAAEQILRDVYEIDSIS